MGCSLGREPQETFTAAYRKPPKGATGPRQQTLKSCDAPSPERRSFRPLRGLLYVDPLHSRG